MINNVPAPFIVTIACFLSCFVTANYVDYKRRKTPTGGYSPAYMAATVVYGLASVLCFIIGAWFLFAIGGSEGLWSFFLNVLVSFFAVQCFFHVLTRA